jgi:hypothetical protein
VRPSGIVLNLAKAVVVEIASRQCFKENGNPEGVNILTEYNRYAIITVLTQISEITA